MIHSGVERKSKVVLFDALYNKIGMTRDSIVRFIRWFILTACHLGDTKEFLEILYFTSPESREFGIRPYQRRGENGNPACL